MSATTLFTVPFLALISIPLAISASITFSLSILALFLQLSVVSIELCYALFVNLFTIPLSTSWSLLSFTASEPTTPGRQQSFDYGLGGVPSPYHPAPAFRGQSRPSLGPRRSSTNLLDSQDSQESPIYIFDSRYAHRPNLQRNLPYSSSSGFRGLISGDEDRDFEGLGGWRCPPSSSKSPGYRSGHTSPSSNNSLSDEIDDIAWLSINRRLELPSQPLTLRGSEGSTEPYLPGRKGRQAAVASTGTDTRGEQHHNHHHRSATTSMVSGLGLQSPSSPSLSGSAQHESHTHSMRSGGIYPRSMSHTSLSAQWERPSAVMTVLNGGGSYFALHPESGVRTTSNSTPEEERKHARSGAGNRAGISGGSRHRRMSMSGAHPVASTEERLSGSENAF